MTAKDSMCNKLTAAIDADDIESVLKEAKKQLADGATALKLLVNVNQLVYKATVQKSVCKSSINTIVQLCELCCSTIISKWNHSIEKTRVYGCLYHVVNYLIIQGHTEYINKFCSYILTISEQSNEKETNEEEKKMLQHFVLLLVISIGKSLNKFCQHLLDESEKSLLTFCKLIFKIDNLCDYSNNSTILTFLLRVSHFCKVNGHANSLTFQIKCLHFLSPKTVTDFEKLIQFLYSILFESINLNPLQDDCNFLLEYAKTFENNVDDENKNLFSFFYNIILLLTCKSEETVFIKVINKCNLLLNDWYLNNENNSAIITSCSYGIIVVFKTRNQLLTHISSFNSSPRTIQPIFDFFNNFHNILKVQSCELCVLPSGEKCLLKVDGMKLVNCQYLILDLISTFGKNCKDILKKYYSTAVKAQQECLQWLEQMKLLKCPKLEIACNWAYTVIVNISRLLITVHEDALEFITTAFKFMLLLPTEILHTPDFTTKALCLTACLGNILYEQGKLDECLTVLTAFLCVWPQSGILLFNLWEDFKHNQMVLANEEFMDLTIYHIVKEKKEVLERDWTVCNFSNSDIVNFLLLEMNVYYNNSLLRGKPLLAAFSALRKLTGDTVIIGRALVMAMEVSSSLDKYSSELEKHLELSNKILPMLKKQVIKKSFKDAGELEFLIGDILYQQFRCDIRSARSKSESEISLSVIHSESRNSRKQQVPVEDTNPNDKCDVNPVYPSLSIKTQSVLLKKIDEAIKQWEIACSKVTEKPDKIAVTLENMWNAALMYKLYCLEDKEIASWRLLYTVAKKFCDVEMQIVAVSELLEVDPDLPSGWVDECNEEAAKPNVKVKIKSAFQINWIKQCLIQKKMAECLPTLETFISQWKNHNITFIMALLKINNFQSILSAINIDSYLPSDVTGLQKSLSMCVGYIQAENEPRNFTELSQIHDFGLKASHDLGVLYWNMKLPRSARCFLKAQITIAQKLVLPLRTAQLLSLLAWLDLDCENSSDAGVKLEGLEAILNIEYLETTATEAYSTSSPTFKKPFIKLPDFLSHEESCKCFPCNNVEYQRLVLETVILRAEYSNLIGDKNIALHFFKVGIKIVNELFGQRKISSEALNNSRVRLWLRYSDFQGLQQNYNDAIEANQKANKFLDPKDFFNHSEILYKLYNLQEAQRKVLQRNISVEAKSVTMKTFKTPSKFEMKYFNTPAPRPFTIKKSPIIIVNRPITPLQPIRPICFDSSDDDDDDEICKENKPVVQKKTKVKNKTPPKFVLQSPLTLFPPMKKERKLFSVFSDEGDNLSSIVKKTYQTKKKTEMDKSVFPASNVSKVEPKRKLFANDINSKSNIKSRSAAMKSSEVPLKSTRNTKTIGQTKTTGQTKTSSSATPGQIPSFTKNCSRTTKKSVAEVMFSFAEMESALNDTNSSSTVVEGTPPKPAKINTPNLGPRTRNYLKTKISN